MAEHDNSTDAGAHRPVMLDEALTALKVRADGTYVDATFGRGGHSAAILARLGPRGRLMAFDQDEAAVRWAERRFGDDARFTILHASFADLSSRTTSAGLADGVQGVLLDLGVSSPQLDAPERGFSFRHDGPLDMRMDRSRGETAAEWIARAEQREIARVLRDYGEEKKAGAIARAIVAARGRRPLTRTLELAGLIADVVGRSEKKHPATRSFQALRIAVNGELDALRSALPQAVDLLVPGGRLVVISFHSLEDRIVKRFLRDQSRVSAPRRGLPPPDRVVPLRLVGRKQVAGEHEVAANPRARSAVMRAAEKCA